jgi:hypothetical protein
MKVPARDAQLILGHSRLAVILEIYSTRTAKPTAKPSARSATRSAVIKSGHDE